jgi:homoserine dehydrogenase
MKKIRVGIIGFGTIGAGVVKVLQSKRAFLREKSGIDISIKRICDKDLKTKRSVRVARSLLTRSLTKVIYDKDIDIVVELVGGLIPARDIVLESLKTGKHVVTANKALLSQEGKGIFDLANELGLCVGFEASVGGGIPVIRAIEEGFIANRMDLLYGIINGTSNFILTKMAQDGLDFKDALAIAQAKGYAERDPSLDISGGDSAHKLSLLALLAFGISAKPSEIYTEGISDIEAIDIESASSMGYSIKLLAIAKRAPDGLELKVHPTLIPSSHLLAGVNGVYNAIFVKGDLIGENLFYGQGAGATPTSSAVVSDIIAIARNMSSGRCCKIEKCVAFKRDVSGIKAMDDIKSRFYVRFSAIDKPGVLARISSILAKYKISIASVTQTQRKVSGVVPIIMVTHEARESDMSAALKEIDALKAIRKKTMRVRIEG